jgi:hypothetical protein
MAKSRSSAAKPVTTLDQVRSLLTSAEQKVLHSSMGAAIAKASKEQVEAAMARARSLRDKWRDLHADQTRSTKRSAKAGTPVNHRTKAKHDVFDGAVKRFEARLAEFAAGVRAAVGGKPSRLTAAAKPTKAARTKSAREGRASVRSALKETTAEINRARKPAKAKPASKTSAKAAVAKPAAPVAVAVAPATRTVSKKRKKPVAPQAAVAQKRFALDAAQQRSAKASAKAARLKFDGATTRRAGNALASTKRAQARRDGRRR